MLTLISPTTPDLGEVASRIAAHSQGLAKRGHREDDVAEPIVVAFAQVTPS
jgi:hypothetical protein